MYLNYLQIKNPAKTLKKLIIFFYIYMICEGILRKWLFPSLYKEIYFLKDFFLIIIYYLAFKYNYLFESKISKILTMFIIITSFFGMMGYNLNKIDILSYVLGCRSYWLFAPLALIVMHVFTFQDIKKFTIINLYFILPYYALIVFQSYQPVEAIINSGFFSIVNTSDRPSAYFTYITQNLYFFIFLLSIFLSYFINESFYSKKKYIFFLFLNFFLMGIMILLKSRASYFYTIVIVSYACYITLINHKNNLLKLKKLLLIIVLTPIFFNLNIHIFNEQYKISKVRMNTDDASNFILVQDKKVYKVANKEFNLYQFCIKNSSICRVLNEIYFIPSIKEASMFGEGIGAGTTTVAIIKKVDFFALGEAENHRILGELGYLFGTAFLTIKYLFVIFLNFMFFFTKKVTNKLFYFPLLTFVSVALLIGPITYTTSFISFISWFSLGLILNSFNKTNEKI